MQWEEHITVPSRWSHFIRGFPLVLVLALSWSRSSFACLRSNTVNTPSRHSLENEKKICILTACLKTLTSSNGFPCTVLRLLRQTKSEAPGYQEQLHAMRPCKWKTCCILLGMRSMRETIQDICESLDHSGISPWAYFTRVRNHKPGFSVRVSQKLIRFYSLSAHYVSLY